MFRRIEEVYRAQAQRVLEAGCGGRKVHDDPVDLEPVVEEATTDHRWPTLIRQRLAFKPVKHPNQPMDEEMASALCFLQLCVADQDDTTPASAEQLLIGLGRTCAPIAFEVIGYEERTLFQLACREPDRTTLEGLLSVQYPTSQVIRASEDHLAQAMEEKELVFAEYDLHGSFAYMLSAFTSFKGIDPLAVALGALEEMPAGACGAIQVLFQPVDEGWRGLLRRAAVDPYDESLPSQPGQEDLVACVEKKIASPLFAVAIRLMGSDLSILGRLEGFLALFNSPENRLVQTAHSHPRDLHQQIITERSTYRHGLLLNASELAGLVHLPSASVQADKLQRTGVKTVPLVRPFRDRKKGVLLGINHHRGREWEVRLTEEELTRHLFCCGVSGTGKSTFLQNLLLQLIEQGYGLAVLDPHGDLVEQHLLPRIPKHRRDDVIWFDPADDEYPIAFNILAAEDEAERELLSEDLVSIFQRTTSGWGPRLESILAYAVLAVVGSKQGGTLNDLRRFLADEEVRSAFLADHPDEDVRYFWTVEFPTLPKGAVAPVQTRLNTFLRRRRIRNIVGQQRNRLAFRRIMDEGKILLCKLAHGAVGEANSYLLGSLLCARLQQTAMMRQDVAEEKRRTFILAIDEFHNFVCRSMETILSGARKYHLGLCLAHQELQQVWGRDREVAASVLANPYTRLCFRVGDQDAKQLVEGFAGFSTKDLQNLSRGQALVRLDRSDYSCNLETLSPPPMPADGEKIARQIIEHSRKTYGTPIEEAENQVRSSGAPPDGNPPTEDDFYA